MLHVYFFWSVHGLLASMRKGLVRRPRSDATIRITSFSRRIQCNLGLKMRLYGLEFLSWQDSHMIDTIAFKGGPHTTPRSCRRILVNGLDCICGLRTFFYDLAIVYLWSSHATDRLGATSWRADWSGRSKGIGLNVEVELFHAVRLSFLAYYDSSVVPISWGGPKISMITYARLSFWSSSLHDSAGGPDHCMREVNIIFMIKTVQVTKPFSLWRLLIAVKAKSYCMAKGGSCQLRGRGYHGRVGLSHANIVRSVIVAMTTEYSCDKLGMVECGAYIFRFSFFGWCLCD